MTRTPDLDTAGSISRFLVTRDVAGQEVGPELATPEVAAGSIFSVGGAFSDQFAAIQAEQDLQNTRLDQVEQAQTGGSYKFETYAALTAIDPTPDPGVGAEIYNDSGTHVDPVTGLTVDNEGAYRGHLLGWFRISDATAKSNQDKIEALETLREQAGIRVQERADYPVKSFPPNSDAWSSTPGVAGWGLGYSTHTADTYVDGFMMYLGNTVNVDHFEVRVLDRVLAGADATTWGGVAGDIVRLPTFTARWDSNDGPAKVRVQFRKPFEINFGRKYVFLIAAMDASDNLITVNRLSRAQSGWEAGFQLLTGGTYTALGSSGIGVTGYLYQLEKTERPPSLFTRVINSPTFSGLSLNMTMCLLQDEAGGLRPLWGQGASSFASTTAPGANSVAVNGYSLAYFPAVQVPTPGGLVFAGVQWIGYSHLTSVEVRRASNNDLLVEGVDYAWDEHGYIWGMVDTAAFNVNVTLNYVKERYVLMYYDPSGPTLTIVGRLGPNGNIGFIEAHEDVYRPTQHPSGQPIFWVYVVGTAIRDVIPAWEWRGLVKWSDPAWLAQLAAIREHSIKCLARFRAKLLRGTGVTVGAYGDSNTAAGAGSYSSEGDAAFQPNRAGVDNDPGIFTGTQAQHALLASYRTAYLASANARTAVVNGETKIWANWPWWVIRAIETGWGYTFHDGKPGAQQVTYLNFGIGATTAETSDGNGRDPDRLAATVTIGTLDDYPAANDPADRYQRPDLMFIAFSINDNTVGVTDIHPSATWATNLQAIIDFYLALGVDVMLVPQFRTPDFGKIYDDREYMEIAQVMLQIAYAKGVAISPWFLYDGPGNDGFVGAPRDARCRANFINHPLQRERRLLGEVTAQFFYP